MLDVNSTYIEINTDDKKIIDEFIKTGEDKFNIPIRVITNEKTLNELSTLDKYKLED